MCNILKSRALTLICHAFVALFYLASIANADEIRSIISEAIERVYTDSRFDQISVSVEACEIRLFIKDNQACSDGAQIQSLEYYYDLTAHSAEYRDQYAKPKGNEWEFTIIMNPEGSWKKQKEKLRQQGKKYLNDARKKLGSGQAAVIAANKEASKNRNIEEFSSMGSTGYCPADTIYGPFANDIRLQGADVSDLVHSFKSLMKACSVNNQANANFFQ
jgi:hypothetical protein